MPRARVGHKLIRIPIQPEIAYDLAYHYDPRKDEELIKKHQKKLGELGEKFLGTLIEGKRLSPKQRLVILQKANPGDLRLKAIEACIVRGNKQWMAKFRDDPKAAYSEELAAVEKAIRDIDCEAKILETVG
jgi:hypothetical protein